MAGSSGTACPGFSVLRFRRRFLSRMWTPKGNGQGCPFQSDAAWMPLEDDRSLSHTFSFCLETSSRKKCTENRDRQFRCCRLLKKLTHGHPPPNITFRLNCYLPAVKINFRDCGFNKRCAIIINVQAGRRNYRADFDKVL